MAAILERVASRRRRPWRQRALASAHITFTTRVIGLRGRTAN